DPGGQVEIIAAPGRYAEVEEIGRWISALIDQGAAPESIAVAVHDLGVYGPLVEDVFRRFRLPLFFRRGEPLAIQAPVRAVQSLLGLAGSEWDRDLVLDLMASPYLDLGISLPWTKAAELSARAGVTDERAGGGWTGNLSRLAQTSPQDRPDIEVLLEGVKRLKKILRPLDRPRTWTGMVQTTFGILNQLKLEEKIRESPRPFLHRDAPAWEALKGCLEELAAAAREAGLEHERLEPENLRQGLGLALTDRNIGARGGAAGGIMVLSVYDLHGLNFDHLFLAGLNEGEFPRPQSEGMLLDDDLRRSINKKAGQRVLTTSAADYRQEELLFHQALSAASQRLVLSYSRMDEEGRVRLPSALLDQVLRLWPEGGLEVIELSPQVTPPLDQALTREELAGGLARHILSLEAKPESALAREVLAGLLERPLEKARWERLVRLAGIEPIGGLGLDDKSGGQIAPALLESWLAGLNSYQGSPLISPSFIEDYAQCPFAFWARRILGLEEPKEAEDEVSGLDAGSIMHRILYLFLTSCRDKGFLPLKGEPKEGRLLGLVSEEVWTEAEKTRPLGRRPLWRARRGAMSRNLKRWLEQEQTKGDEYLPTHFEWRFGPDQGAGPLEVPLISGGRLFFQGQVDRIDLSPSACLVIDYKNTNNEPKYKKLLREEELGRTSFQAPLYQAAVSRAMDRPSQATWALLRSLKPFKLKTPSTDSDFFTLDAAKRLDMSRNDSSNFFNRLEDTWLNMTKGDFSPNPETGPCDFCSLRTSCRVFRESESS
ncbi:MAG: PD-(D/E)XK nuclease family protein, partial [Thermodesulfobacteriota bacterium]|nr:PD-(D/E)XK nuclease family protein [Thermodesulfobacteriota bacterium]